MTARQLKAARRRMGISQANLAAALDLHVRTISKWERGVQPIPKAVGLAIKWLEHTAPRGEEG